MLKFAFLASIATGLSGLLFVWSCLLVYRGPVFPPQSEGLSVVLMVLWFEFLGWTNDVLAWLQYEKSVRLLPFEFHETTWGTGIDGGPVEYLPVRDKIFAAYPFVAVILIAALLITLRQA